MAKVFFNKKIFSNAFVVGGKRAPFEHIGDNQGLLVLDDADPNQKEMLDGLNEAARMGRGGVLKISEEEYNQKKKALPFDPSVNESKQRKQMLGVVPPQQKPRPKPVAASPVVRAEGESQSKEQIYSEPTPEWKNAPKNTQGLRLDGPTRDEYLAARGTLEGYPPRGYVERDTPASKDPAILRHYRPQTKRLENPPK